MTSNASTAGALRRGALLLGAGALWLGCEAPRPPPVAISNSSASSATTPSAMPSSTPPASAPAASSAAASPTFESQAHGCALSTTLRADKTRLLPGEPVFVTFRVATPCGRKLAVLDGGDYRNRLGRANSFRLTVVSAAGEVVPVIDPGPEFGGLMGPVEASPRPFEKRLLVAHWVELTKPGVYTITVEKALLVGEAMTADEKDKVAVPMKVSTTVEVLPASAEQLGQMIDALGQQASRDQEHAEPLQALLTIKDARAVPHLIRLTEQPSVSRRMSGVMGLRPFGTDEALAALVKALETKELRLTTAQVLAENPHPKAWDALWALRTDSDDNIRLTVLHRLARRQAPDTEARLKEFEKDRATMIQGEAQRYLRERAARR
jgi:hypothetical protein